MHTYLYTGGRAETFLTARCLMPSKKSKSHHYLSMIVLALPLSSAGETSSFSALHGKKEGTGNLLICLEHANSTQSCTKLYITPSQVNKIKEKVIKSSTLMVSNKLKFQAAYLVYGHIRSAWLRQCLCLHSFYRLGNLQPCILVYFLVPFEARSNHLECRSPLTHSLYSGTICVRP